MTALDRFCPACGQPRSGYLRFCRGCGFDFEARAAEPQAPQPSSVQQPVQMAAVTGGPSQPRGTWGRRRYAAIAAAVVIGLGAIGAASPDDPADEAALTAASSEARVAADTSTPAPTRTARPTSRPTPTATAVPTFGPSGTIEIATVTRIVDGDTIRVEIDGVEYPVRYIGVDTPEPDAEDPHAKALADAATAANTGLVEGREVILERDVSDTDQFDRLLRNVWIETGDTFVLVGLELVRQGYAQVATFPPDVKYVDLLLHDERLAKAGEVGLWAPVPTPAPTVPPVVAVDDEARYIVTDDRPRFTGEVGDYTWTTMQFETDRVTVRWSATAPANARCRIAWQIQPSGGSIVKRTVRVEPGEEVTGNARYDTAFLDAAFVVDSTCPDWWMSMQGVNLPPPPTPRPATGGSGSSCHPSYKGACLKKNAGDYDCSSGSGNGPNYVGTVSVVGPDEFDLDRDGDGVGCEDG